jgi:hypothetical protein
MFDPNTETVKEVMHPILPPNEFTAALFNHGPAFWKEHMVGVTDPAQYWSHVKAHCPWYSKHPIANAGVDTSKLIGISIHGDEVKCYKNTDGKVLIVSFTSDFCESPSLRRFWPIAVVPYHHLCFTIASVILICGFIYMFSS